MIWQAWISMQIILEMMPISSSGHLLLFEYIGQRMHKIIIMPVVSQELVDVLYDSIQLPTIMVIITYFFNDWFFCVKNYAKVWRIILKLIALVFITDLITAGWYLLIKHYHLWTIPLWLGFAITGLLLLSLRWCYPACRTYSWMAALILGCAQGMALLPGISRFASTFVAARWYGINARRAFQLTWLIELPLISAACLYSLLFKHNLIIWHEIMHFSTLMMIGISSIIALGCLFCMHWLVSKGYLYYVAWYMVFPSIVALMLGQ